jgi:hypothetical protein
MRHSTHEENGTMSEKRIWPAAVPLSQSKTFETDERGVSNELTIEKHEDGAYRVFVKPEEDGADSTLVEDSDADAENFAAVRRLVRLVGAGDGHRLVVVLKGPKVWEVSSRNNEDAERPVTVEFDPGMSPDAHAQIDRLFRVLGGADADELDAKEERPIDADDSDRALVLPQGRRAKGDDPLTVGRGKHIVLARGTPAEIYPSHLLQALYEIERAIDGEPGDPGRAVHLAERVRRVTETRNAR